MKIKKMNENAILPRYGTDGASGYEAKMSEEIGQCTENMAVIFQDSNDLLAKYKALKRKRQ